MGPRSLTPRLLVSIPLATGNYGIIHCPPPGAGVTCATVIFRCCLALEYTKSDFQVGGASVYWAQFHAFWEATLLIGDRGNREELQVVLASEKAPGHL